MTDIERQLTRAMNDTVVIAPGFDEVFRNAEAQVARARRRRQSALGLAAAVMIVAVLLPSGAPESPGLITADELLGTTSWSPPSDVLLPSRGTDIFYGLPELPESTNPAGGALL